MGRFTCEAISIMYHDVVDDAGTEASGFSGHGAGVYKMSESEFRAHLAAIREVTGGNGVGLAGACWDGTPPLFLTFDDGGASCHSRIAGMLEENGWRGHFFVATDYIGQPGFVSATQVRDLHQRGHIIGSHSCSHPPRISHCDWAELMRQWRSSAAVLADITGEPVTVASVPGGFYAPRVAQAAAQAGIGVLFTSEPTTRVREVAGCLVLGRYFVQRGMAPEVSADFISGRWATRARQAALWRVKRIAKAAGGGVYFTVREFLLAMRAG